MSQDMSQDFNEAMKSKKMYKKLLKKHCGGENTGTSNSLRDLVSLAIRHIIQIIELSQFGSKENRGATKDLAFQLESKLIQRWDLWKESLQKDTLKVLLRQSWDLANKRSSFEEVEKQLKQQYMHLCSEASKEKLGMEVHVKNVMNILMSKHIVGVCGMAGVGKTALLQDLERKIRDQDKHLVAHLEVKQQNMEDLQQSICFQLNRKPILNLPVVRPQNPEAGREQLARFLQALKYRGKKGACIIIDGVFTEEFLSHLLPSNVQELLSPPSCLIASTRDKAVAHALFEFCCKDINEESSLYMLSPLQPLEAKALFCAKAEGDGIFLQEKEEEIFMNDIVPLCGGLPLALVKCGSYFSSKENRANKERVKRQLREALKELPSRDIFGVLEEMIDPNYLEAFMDVALFWKDKDWKKAKLAMMEEDGRRDILNHLQEKFLILHDEERLVKVPVFMKALARRFAHENHRRYLKNALPTLQEMDQVRGLLCNNRDINIDDLSAIKELRYLDFKKCPLHLNLVQTFIPFLASLPIQRHLFLPLLFAFLLPNIILFIYSPIIVSLVILSTLLLIFSLVNQIYSPPRSLPPHLTFLTISDCDNAKKLLRQISKLHFLRYLNLSFNSSLCVLPQNFFINLASLIHLDLSNCENLQQIPPSIGNLRSLQILDLSTCGSLQELPNTISQLVSLESLLLSNCYGLSTLPNTIGGLKSLRSLKLSNCATLKRLPLALFNLNTLQNLDVSQNTKLEGWWQNIANLISLEYLNMSNYDKLEDLPAAIGNLKALKVLNLANCRRLKRLPETLGKLNSLVELYLSSCDDLEYLPMDSIQNLPSLEKISVPMKYKDVAPPTLQKKFVVPQQN